MMGMMKSSTAELDPVTEAQFVDSKLVCVVNRVKWDIGRRLHNHGYLSGWANHHRPTPTDESDLQHSLTNQPTN